MTINRLAKEIDPAAIEQILVSLSGLTHGSVQIIVQDSKIVQIDRIEKVRLGKKSKGGGASGS